MGIIIRYKEYSNVVKGYYLNINNYGFITLNKALSTDSHELTLAMFLGYYFSNSLKDSKMIKESTLYSDDINDAKAIKFAEALLDFN